MKTELRKDGWYYFSDGPNGVWVGPFKHMTEAVLDCLKREPGK